MVRNHPVHSTTQVSPLLFSLLRVIWTAMEKPPSIQFLNTVSTTVIYSSRSQPLSHWVRLVTYRRAGISFPCFTKVHPLFHRSTPTGGRGVLRFRQKRPFMGVLLAPDSSATSNAAIQNSQQFSKRTRTPRHLGCEAGGVLVLTTQGAT